MYHPLQVLSHAETERQKSKLTEKRKEALAQNILSLADLFAVEMEKVNEAEAARDAVAANEGAASARLLGAAHGSVQIAPQTGGTKTASEDRMGKCIRHMFFKFDKDMSGSLDKDELRTLSTLIFTCISTVKFFSSPKYLRRPQRSA